MLARTLHGLLGLVALTGCAFSLWNGWHRDGTTPDGTAVVFAEGWANMLNSMVFFTFMSNALVAISSLQLAVSRDWARTWHPVRIAGLISITITGVVFNLLLNPGDQVGLEAVNNVIVHILTPIAAPLLWLLFGPREATMRRLLLGSVIPLVWLGVTLARGVAIGWYPYTIIDVTTRGWVGAGTMIVAILVLFYMLGALVVATDAWFRRRQSPTDPEPTLT